MNQKQTADLVHVSKHISVSVALYDSVSESPTFIEHEDPKMLVQVFVEELERRHALIVEEVNSIYSMPSDFNMHSASDQKAYNDWLGQVAVVSFDKGKYDLNMIKQYFVKRIAENAKIKVAKKHNNYMFLTTSRFKFLDILNFLAPGMNYE